MKTFRNVETTPQSLRQLAEEIAKELGENWHRSTKFDADDSADVNPWRMRLENGQNRFPVQNDEALFLSTTWANKAGQLHIGGWYPEYINHNTAQRVGHAPSINVSISKTPKQIAADIKRRLLPEYRTLLAKVLEEHRKDAEFKTGTEKLKAEVAKVIGGTVREGSEVIYGGGNFDVQVSSPTSLRFVGHCQYLTLDQLKRIKKAVPELFERKES